MTTTAPAARRPRVAAIVTVYFPRSHADVIVSKLLADITHPAPRDIARFDFNQSVRELTEAPLPRGADGTLRPPRLEVVSMYVEQFPENDIGREWSERSGVPIYSTVREALTLGGDSLAVDGVLLIGEHGDYPVNEKGQKEYPRRRLFEAVVDVMRESGRAVPIFNDKHIGYAWDDAKWMYDTARELGIPFGAGSSISTVPLHWRVPPVTVPLGAALDGAVAVGYGPLEIYGFHNLEVLQCMVERRAGGETGVAAVQTLTGPAVWEALAGGAWDRELFDAALATVDPPLTQDVTTLVKEPIVFLVEYRDGLRAAVPFLNGAVQGWYFACRVAAGGDQPRGTPTVLATRFRSHSQEPFGHFSWLLEEIQDLICTGIEPHPVERTLLTTGILDRAMESHQRGGIRVETPELAIRYRIAGR